MRTDLFQTNEEVSVTRSDSARGESILIVDDDLGIRQVLQITLSLFDFEVADASTGERAIELTAHNLFDAILLDMNMPGMGGIAACRELRRRSPSLPILMLTVRDSDEDKMSAFLAGADDYVTKPFEITELAARIRALVHLCDPTRGAAA